MLSDAVSLPWCHSSIRRLILLSPYLSAMLASHFRRRPQHAFSHCTCGVDRFNRSLDLVTPVYRAHVPYARRLTGEVVDGVAALGTLLVRADLADALEHFVNDVLFGETGEEAAHGVRCPVHRRGDPRPAGIFVTADHGEDLCVLRVLWRVGHIKQKWMTTSPAERHKARRRDGRELMSPPGNSSHALSKT